MPLYELHCITRALREAGGAPLQGARRATPNGSFLEQLMKKTSLLVQSNGGVVRQIKYHGENPLPYRMKAHQTWHYEGKTWTMLFDAAPQTLSTIRDQLRRDLQVIRFNMVNMGSTLRKKVPNGTTLDQF